MHTAGRVWALRHCHPIQPWGDHCRSSAHLQWTGFYHAQGRPRAHSHAQAPTANSTAQPHSSDHSGHARRAAGRSCNKCRLLCFFLFDSYVLLLGDVLFYDVLLHDVYTCFFFPSCFRLINARASLCLKAWLHARLIIPCLVAQYYNVPFNNTNALLVTKNLSPAPAPSASVDSSTESPGVVVAIAVPVAVVGTLGVVGALLVGYIMYRRKHPKPTVRHMQGS